MLSTAQAAEILGVSQRRVIALVKQGDLPAEKIGGIWLLDESAVRQRAAAPVPSGRPRMGQKDRLALSEHTLMNAEHPVLDFMYDSKRHAVEITATHDLRYAPLGSGKGAVSAAQPLGEMRPNKYDLLAWLQHRYMPPLRPEARALLEEAQVASVDMLMFGSLGLNLSDCFWFKPRGSRLTWADVNFYENGYSFDPRAPMRTPDSSTPGMLPKRWMRRGGIDVLVKGASSAEDREPYGELLATRLLARLLEPDDFVPYELELSEGRAYSVCPTIGSPGCELIAARELVAFAGIEYKWNFYEAYAASCERLGVPDARRQLAKMIVCDYIMANFDRHQGNFGLVRNPQTHEELRIAPLFDNGAAFFSHATLAELKARRYSYTAYPCCEYPTQQLALAEDYSWYRPEALDGFEDDVREVLGSNPHLPEEFAEVAAQQVGRSIQIVNEHAEERR